MGYWLYFPSSGIGPRICNAIDLAQRHRPSRNFHQLLFGAPVVSITVDCWRQSHIVVHQQLVIRGTQSHGPGSYTVWVCGFLGLRISCSSPAPGKRLRRNRAGFPQPHHACNIPLTITSASPTMQREDRRGVGRTLRPYTNSTFDRELPRLLPLIGRP